MKRKEVKPLVDIRSCDIRVKSTTRLQILLYRISKSTRSHRHDDMISDLMISDLFKDRTGFKSEQ